MSNPNIYTLAYEGLSPEDLYWYDDVFKLNAQENAEHELGVYGEKEAMRVVQRSAARRYGPELDVITAVREYAGIITEEEAAKIVERRNNGNSN